MDKTALVGIDLEGGKELIKALDKTGMYIPAALWLYFPEPEEWRLVIATPKIDKEGPRKIYTQILSVLRKINPPLDIPFRNISIMSSKSEFIKNLKQFIKTEPKALADIRVFSSGIGNTFIEGAYIYRMS